MYKLSFDFEKRDLSNLERINSALAGMRGEISIEDCAGCLATTTVYDRGAQHPTGVSLDFCFDRLILACEEAESGADRVWRIDTRAFRKDECPDADLFHDLWKELHPGLVMRSLIQYAFNDDAEAFVILYHDASAR